MEHVVAIVVNITWVQAAALIIQEQFVQHRDANIQFVLAVFIVACLLNAVVAMDVLAMLTDII
jgi:hypothetical protein